MKPKIKFTKQEIKDIIIAWIGISICFTIVFGNLSLLSGGLIDAIKGNTSMNLFSYIFLFIISLIVTGTSFIFHELAHKFTAIYFGAKANFVMWLKFVVGAIVLAFGLGFIFVAPGAVYIYGKDISVRENGIISIAGPLTNILVGFIFLLLNILIPNILFTLGFTINMWIAFFNLIPFGPLDGRKVLTWNPIAWMITMAIPLFLVII
jgi:Zn-dependent protease